MEGQSGSGEGQSGGVGFCPINPKKKKHNKFFCSIVENLIARARIYAHTHARGWGGVYGIVAVKKMKQLHGKSG